MGKKVLIVDDAAFMRMMIKDILTKNGFDVVGEAADGAQAVEKFKELTPDLVTMDITMPEMDGIAALKEIKQIDPNSIVIMCSAMGQQAMVIDAIQAGAKDLIVRPIQAGRGLEEINKAIEEEMKREKIVKKKLFIALCLTIIILLFDFSIVIQAKTPYVGDCFGEDVSPECLEEEEPTEINEDNRDEDTTPVLVEQNE